MGAQLQLKGFAVDALAVSGEVSLSLCKRSAFTQPLVTLSPRFLSGWGFGGRLVALLSQSPLTPLTSANKHAGSP